MPATDVGIITGFKGIGAALRGAQDKALAEQLALAKMAQSNQLLQAKTLAAQQGADLPSNVREYEYFNSLPTREAKEQYLQVKRAEKYFDTGSGFARVSPMTNQASPVMMGGFQDAGNGIPQPLGKGLTPEQQRDADIKAREERDMFQRGLDVKQKALAATNRLLKNEAGVRANRGGISTLFPNVSNSAVDAAADLETVSNLLTTENLGLLKGVLSDTDMKVLASIGSGELAGSDQKALSALKRMKKALSGQVAGMQAAKQNLAPNQMPPLKSDFIDMPINPNQFAPEAGAPIINPKTRAVGNSIPASAAQRLRANPSEAAQFDEIFGKGASKRVLGR